ncbi:hypothetical protein KIPB_009922, partial [Kipferlia bialata]
YLHDLEPNHLVTSSTHVRVVVFSPVQPTSVTWDVVGEDTDLTAHPMELIGTRSSREVGPLGVYAGEASAFVYAGPWTPSVYGEGLHYMEVTVHTDMASYPMTEEEREARHLVEGITVAEAYTKVYPFSLDGTSMSLYDKGSVATFVDEVTDSVGDLASLSLDFPELVGRAFYFSIFHSPVVVAFPFLCCLVIIVIGSVLMPKAIAHCFVTKQALASYLVHNHGREVSGTDPAGVRLAASYTSALLAAVSKGHEVREARVMALAKIKPQAWREGWIRYSYCRMHELLGTGSEEGVVVQDVSERVGMVVSVAEREAEDRPDQGTGDVSPEASDCEVADGLVVDEERGEDPVVSDAADGKKHGVESPVVSIVCDVGDVEVGDDVSTHDPVADAGIPLSPIPNQETETETEAGTGTPPERVVPEPPSPLASEVGCYGGDPDDPASATPLCLIPAVLDSVHRVMGLFLSKRIDIPTSMVLWMFLPLFCPLFIGYVYYEQPGWIFTYFVWIPGQGLIFDMTTFLASLYVYLLCLTPLLGFLVATSEAVLPGLIPRSWQSQPPSSLSASLIECATNATHPGLQLPTSVQLSEARDTISEKQSAASAATRELQMATESLHARHRIRQGSLLTGLSRHMPDLGIGVYLVVLTLSSLGNLFWCWACLGWWSVFVSPAVLPFSVYAVYTVTGRLRRRAQIRQEWLKGHVGKDTVSSYGYSVVHPSEMEAE